MGERNRIDPMEKHVHGGNIYKYKDCLDFSANCNPLGTPEAVIQAGIESLHRVSDYPEVGYLPLREAIADYENKKFQILVPESRTEGQRESLEQGSESARRERRIMSDQIICGNGAAELIFTLCRALSPKRALLPAPTFAEYRQALESVGCEICFYYLSENMGFGIQEDFLEYLTPEIDMVFLCNPNNPTGVLTEKSFLIKVLEKCRENQSFLVVDECFQDFIGDPEDYTLKEELHSYGNLFLLKAFTKRYAMAGIRLGYGLCQNADLLENMERFVQPWNISTIAISCGIAALKEEEYVMQGRRIIFQEKDYLKREMRNLGLEVYDSRANYLFFKGPENLFEQCVGKGILIRDCSNYEGLKKGYYRIAVKLHEDNKRLIQVLSEILGQKRE